MAPNSIRYVDPDQVPIRDAATVMLLRDPADGEPGVEVFVLKRTASAAFGAGMYVFPGGRVDPEDAGDEIETFCRGLSDDDASGQLGIDAGGLAYWVAAIRECFEEAGVLLAEPRNGGALDVSDEERVAVHDGELSMAELCRRHDLVLDLTTTHYVDHWITPIGEQRRFDTRFFVTDAPDDQVGSHDDAETVDSTWIRPETALEMVDAGDLMMMPPTVANLRWLTEFASADDAVAAGAAKDDVPTTLPKIRFADDGSIAGVVMPSDPDYDTL
ncbi:MAG: NUDIX hydrolase [Actinomycetota bacterium]